MPTSPRTRGMVGVVAAVGGQVEGHAEALLPGRQVAPVERVGLLGGGEPGVLPDRPRLGGVHRRVRPAQERTQPGVGVQRVEAVEVLGAVHREDLDALRAQPRLVGEPVRDGHRSASRVRLRNVEGVDADRAGVVHGQVSRPAREDHVGGPGAAQGGDRLGAALGVGAVGAGQADDRLAGVRREQVVDAGRRAGDLHRDAAGGEQVGGEGGPGRVRGHRAEGGQEDRAGSGVVAHRLEGGAVAADLAPGVVGLARRQRLAEVRELAHPGERPLATARRPRRGGRRPARSGRPRWRRPRPHRRCPTPPDRSRG